MGRPRNTVKELTLSGRKEIQKTRYQNYNDTQGVPVTDITDVKPPKGISKQCKAAWKLTVPALIQMGALSQTDIVELHNLFYAYDEFLKARDAVRAFDLIHPTVISKDDIQSRRVLNAWMMQSLKQFNSLAGVFGLHPADRSKLITNDIRKDEGDPLDQIIRG